MIVRLFDEPKPVKEQEFILKLFRNSIGRIIVGVVDDEGNLRLRGILIEFQDDMSILRKGFVNPDLGVPLDDGKIVEVKD